MREELGALVVLMRHSGLEGMQDFPPHGAHARPEAALLFELVTLEESTTHKQLAGVRAPPFPVSVKKNNSLALRPVRSGSLNKSVHMLRMLISRLRAGRLKV